MAKRPSYFPKKRDLASTVLHFESAEMAQAYPALYELLCHARRDDRFRAGARLTFFCEDMTLKVSIWDPDTSMVYFATLQGFEGALEAVERLLEEGRGEWRAKKEQNGRR